MVVGEPSVTPPVAPVRGHDYQVQRPRAFDLEPSPAPDSGAVAAVQPLRHYAFMTGGAGGVIELLALGQVGGQASAYQLQSRVPPNLLEHREALHIGPIDQKLVAHTQDVEKEQSHRRL